MGEINLENFSIVALDTVAFIYYVENHPNYLRLISLTHDIVEKAPEIRARHNLRTPNPVQIATAILNNADLLITNDRKLKRITEINVAILYEI
jgi:predicted nucleic acid-binding protein